MNKHLSRILNMGGSWINLAAVFLLIAYVRLADSNGYNNITGYSSEFYLFYFMALISFTIFWLHVGSGINFEKESRKYGVAVIK